MKAIVLAAGVGRRFGRRTKKLPKCLVPLDKDGQTLLSRYLRTFSALGIRDVVVVVGHHRTKIKKACVGWKNSLNIRFVFNRLFKKGSIVSLHSARHHLSEDCLVMDADVYFPEQALKKLIRSKTKSAFLIDARSKSAGEEMMLMAKGLRPWGIAKKVDPSLEILGEATGIFKISKKDGSILKKILENFIQKKVVDVEYEESYQVLMRKIKVGYVSVGKIFWTEMDFEEDLRKIKRHSERSEESRFEKRDPSALRASG